MSDEIPTRLSERDTATELGISLTSLRALRRRGLIGYVRILNRYFHTPAHIRAYIDSQTVNACPHSIIPESPATFRDIGLSKSRAEIPASGTGRGTTPHLVKFAEEQRAKEILTLPKRR